MAECFKPSMSSALTGRDARTPTGSQVPCHESSGVKGSMLVGQWDSGLLALHLRGQNVEIFIFFLSVSCQVLRPCE